MANAQAVALEQLQPRPIDVARVSDDKPLWPFLRWAGGKQQLVSELIKRCPREFRRYHEPFLGAGCLFFQLRPSKALLADANRHLIETYRALRTNWWDIAEELSIHG